MFKFNITCTRYMYVPLPTLTFRLLVLNIPYFICWNNSFIYRWVIESNKYFFKFFYQDGFCKFKADNVGATDTGFVDIPTKTRTNSRRLSPPLDQSLSPSTQVIGHSSCTKRESTTSPPVALPDLTTVYSLLDTDQTAARIIGWLKIGMMSSDFNFLLFF